MPELPGSMFSSQDREVLHRILMRWPTAEDYASAVDWLSRKLLGKGKLIAEDILWVVGPKAFTGDRESLQQIGQHVLRTDAMYRIRYAPDVDGRYVIHTDDGTVHLKIGLVMDGLNEQYAISEADQLILDGAEILGGVDICFQLFRSNPGAVKERGVLMEVHTSATEWLFSLAHSPGSQTGSTRLASQQ